FIPTPPRNLPPSVSKIPKLYHSPLRSYLSRADELSAFFDGIVLMTPGQPQRDFGHGFAHSFIQRARVIFTEWPDQERASDKFKFHGCKKRTHSTRGSGLDLRQTSGHSNQVTSTRSVGMSLARRFNAGIRW